MLKFSTQQKLSAVEHYLEGKNSFTAVAKQHGMDESMVRRWVKQYEERGAQGLEWKRSSYDAHTKLSVVKHMWENRLSYIETAIFFDIRRPGSIGEWAREYKSGGMDSLTPRIRKRPDKMPAPQMENLQPAKEDKNRTEKELLAEINQLRMENDYLKKWNALVQKEAQAVSAKKRR